MNIIIGRNDRREYTNKNIQPTKTCMNSEQDRHVKGTIREIEIFFFFRGLENRGPEVEEVVRTELLQSRSWGGVDDLLDDAGQSRRVSLLFFSFVLYSYI